MKNKPSQLAPLFRSDTQGRMLAKLFNESDREFTLNELAEAAQTSQPTAWRECQRVAQAGMVTTRAVGRTTLVKANERHPLFAHFKAIVVSSFGAPAVIADYYSDIDGVEAVMIFGSWAARFFGEPGPPPSDIDVLVLGRPNRDALYAAEERAQRILGQELQTTIRPVSAWLNPDEFLKHVHSKKYLLLFVADDNANLADLRARLGE